MLCLQRRNEIVTGKKFGNLYRLSLSVIQAQPHQANVSINMWHRRFGHINNERLSQMAREKAVSGLIINDESKESCDACIMGKHHKVNFRTSFRNKATNFGKMHVDTCGLMPIESLGGANYFVLFVDEYSNFRFIKFIRSKNEVLSVFKEVVAEIESTSDHRINCLHSDHGSEYENNSFIDYLREKGIHKTYSAPYSPEQNGKVERENRSVKELARSMLIGADLPKYLWAEACNSAVYLLNRSINSNNPKSTPFELFYQQKPDVSNLREYGCKAFVKIVNRVPNTPSPKSEVGQLVGYTDRYNTYRIYIPSNRTIKVSRDVILKESNSSNSMPLATSEKNPVTTVDFNISNTSEQIIDSDISNDIDTTSVNHEQIQSTSDSQYPRQIQLRSRGTADDISLPYTGRAFCIYRAYEAQTMENEPTSYEDAISSKESRNWMAAMKEEMTSLNNNEVWSIIKLPSDKKAIKCRWVYKIKKKSNGEIERYKRVHASIWSGLL